MNFLLAKAKCFGEHYRISVARIHVLNLPNCFLIVRPITLHIGDDWAGISREFRTGLNSFAQHQEEQEPHDEEHEEQNFRDSHRRTRDAREAQKARDQRYNEKNQ
jgi:hypothetical protein